MRIRSSGQSVIIIRVYIKPNVSHVLHVYVSHQRTKYVKNDRYRINITDITKDIHIFR